MYKIRFIIISLLLISMAATSCKKKIDPSDSEEPVARDISQFIWNGMYDYYLWYTDVSKLNPATYPTNSDWYRYLNSFDDDYEALFEDLLYQRGTTDRFSWITDDWVALEQGFSGISKTMGYEFGLSYYGSSNMIFGFVQYVIPDSPADNAGISRGDLFVSVDGTLLNDVNYLSLLFGQESYLLGMADIEPGSLPEANGVTHDLSAVVLQENPVHHQEVIDLGNGEKAAYLVYNSFVSDFDMELNDAFAYFKSENVQHLILDLRYNGGGYISSAINLASMIYSTDDTKLFSHEQWNDKLEAYLTSQFGSEYFDNYFASKLDTTTISYQTMPPLPDINCLEMSSVYVLTSDRTASASELVINALEAYIDVIQVGDTTYGKNVGSVTVKDYYTYDYLNPDHKWAMQPIVLKSENALGSSDYFNGLYPDFYARENIAELLPFGNQNDPLLSLALAQISGNRKSMAFPVPESQMKYKVFADSKDFDPLNYEMYVRDPRLNLKEFFPFSDFKK